MRRLHQRIQLDCVTRHNLWLQAGDKIIRKAKILLFAGDPVHRKDTIERLIITVAKEFVCRIRTECLYTLVNEFIDCRNDDLSLLLAEGTVLVGTWVERQYGDTTCVNAYKRYVIEF